jgi:predicted acyltransferase
MMNPPAGKAAKKNESPDSRLQAVDQFRGFTILLMVLANYLAGVKLVPPWLKHAPDIGLTIIDLIAPFFIFAIGLTFGLSWQKRVIRDGQFKTARHFVTRFLALVGIGSILSAGEIWLNIDGTTVNWGVLQAIGTAGLITLPIIGLAPRWRLAIGLVILAVYQGLLNGFWLDGVLHSPHGGMPAALSWAGMMIVATVFADLFHTSTTRKFFLPACLLALAGGLLLAVLFPVSKNRVSISYVLISLAASGLLFALFVWLKIRLPVFASWGKNSLALYILHLLLLGLLVLPAIPIWYASAPLWLVAAQALALIGILSIMGWWLEKKQIFITL